MTSENDEKRARLLAALLETDAVSGQGGSGPRNLVVNVASLIKKRHDIEKSFGATVEDGDLFGVLAAEVMAGGVLVLTDESTTGQAIEVTFHKKVKF